MKKLITCLLTICAILVITSSSWATVTTWDTSIATGNTMYDGYLSAATGSTTTVYDTTTLQVRTSSTASPYTSTNDRVALLKFDISEIPTGVYVWDVKLQLTYSEASSASTMGLYKNLRTDWSETQATWNLYKTGSSWTTTGARSDGNDIYGDFSTGLNALSMLTVWSNSAGSKVAFLSTTPLRNFVQDNLGRSVNFILASKVNQPNLQTFHSSEAAAANKPRLIIVYSNSAADTDYRTFYVRPNGGTATQCSGLVDAPYPGSGSLQPCAFKHPFYVTGTNNYGKPEHVIWKGGDTMIIKNGSYMMGWGFGEQWNYCMIGDEGSSYNCYSAPTPSGPDATHPTRILGEEYNTGCSAKPELWGTRRIERLINLQGTSNVEIQCLELTDHESCQGRSTNKDTPCTSAAQKYGDFGIVAIGGINGLIKNVSIHGLTESCIYAGRLKDWTIEGVDMRACQSAGWNGDVGHGAIGSGSESSNSGNIIFQNSTIKYSGCGETYPGKAIFGCCSQSQGCYGDGLGTYLTGGDWYFYDSEISHNTSDGLDLLYKGVGGKVTIKRSKFEGNAGQQVKIAGSGSIENSIVNGNCGYFKNQTFTSVRSPGFDNCRAAGDTVTFDVISLGNTFEIYNSTLMSDGNILVYSGGGNCNGTEKITARNNIFFGGSKFMYNPENTTLYWRGGSDGNGTGPCGTLPFDEDYSVIAQNFKDPTGTCAKKGAHSVCADPQFAETSTDTFFKGEKFNADLQSSSPARDKALVISGLSSLDFNYFDRGASWDIGALEYGGTAQSCVELPDLCLDEFNCTDNGWNWWTDGTCNTAAESSCNTACANCLAQTTCIDNSYLTCYWKSSTAECTATPTSACDDLCSDCATEGACNASTADGECFWLDGVPDDKCVSKISPSCYNDCELCSGRECMPANHPDLTCYTWIDYLTSTVGCKEDPEYYAGENCTTSCDSCDSAAGCIATSSSYYAGANVGYVEDDAHSCHWDKKLQSCGTGRHRASWGL